MYKDPNRQRRPFKYHRMQSHDYKNCGAYFVTRCAYGRQPLFIIPKLESILKQHWRNLPQHFSNVSLDRFVIMPDHIHFILWVKPNAEKIPSLSKIIQVYKSICAVAWLNYLREHNINEEGRIWQKGYYDRIIRDPQELENTRRYIENNPIVARSKQIP